MDTNEDDTALNANDSEKAEEANENGRIIPKSIEQLDHLMDCQTLENDKTVNCSDKYNNQADNNTSNDVNKTKNDESSSEVEPTGKRYEKSKNNVYNNCTINDDAKITSKEQNDNITSEDSQNTREDACSKKVNENTTVNLLHSSGDSCPNTDEPSCSNQRNLPKSKSSKKKRLRAKSLDDTDEIGSDSVKKTRDIFCEESSDGSNVSQHSDTNIKTKSSLLELENEQNSGETNDNNHDDDDDNDNDDDNDDDDDDDDDGNDDDVASNSNNSDDNEASSEKNYASNPWRITSEDEEKVMQLLAKPKPKTDFFIVPELIKREFGFNRFLHRKFYGSLHVVRRLELMHKMEEHEGCVNAINFNDDGTLLASGSDDLKVVIWDWRLGVAKNSFESGHVQNIFEVKWLSIDYESLIATCARDGQVRLLDLNANVHRKLTSHRNEAKRLAVHHDRPYEILSVGDDGKVLSIDIRAAKRNWLAEVGENGYQLSLNTIHINPRNSNEFCTGGRSQTIQIFDRRRTTQPLMKLCPRNLNEVRVRAYLTCAVYNYNGTEVLASYSDDDIYLFDTVNPHPTGDYAHRYEGHRNSNTVKSANFFGPKSEFIVSGSDCGNIFFWEKNTESIVQWMPGDEQGVVNRLEPHPYVPILATSGLDSDVKIWIPSCEKDPSLTNLESCIKTNFRYRSYKPSNRHDPFDSQILTIFLRHISLLRTMRSHRLSEIGLSRLESDESSNNSPREYDEDSNSSDNESEGPQCTTS